MILASDTIASVTDLTPSFIFNIDLINYIKVLCKVWLAVNISYVWMCKVTGEYKLGWGNYVT